MDAILRELDRLTGVVESQRAADDRVAIEALRREVADLRRTVAHLRAGAGPLPVHLRPVLARAVLAVDAAAT
ncbi:hypothetical protein [Pseudonocardia sp.]|uniref:hypothetical protein n=1 Tax=Pseudonocardia sp. TaxID=60912 RepID=UPI0026088BDF|nr:hypothetical protein [Pseudonocardia sp.]